MRPLAARRSFCEGERSCPFYDGDASHRSAPFGMTSFFGWDLQTRAVVSRNLGCTLAARDGAQSESRLAYGSGLSAEMHIAIFCYIMSYGI